MVMWNVTVGPVENGKQTITLYNGKKGVKQVVSTAPEKIDEFLLESEAINRKSAKRSLITIGLSSVAGVIGSCFVKAADMSKWGKAGLGGIYGLCAGLFVSLLGRIFDNRKLNKLTNDFIDKNS